MAIIANGDNEDVTRSEHALVDGRKGGPQQQRRLVVAGRPSGVAVDALPDDLEPGVHHDHGLMAPTARARDAVFIEELHHGNSFSHAHVFGSDGRDR